MSSLSKSERKSAYVYARNQIRKGLNIADLGTIWEGKLGVCELLREWLVKKNPELVTGSSYTIVNLFPEFSEEKPVDTSYHPFWWDENDDQIRIDVLTNCINKL